MIFGCRQEEEEEEEGEEEERFISGVDYYRMIVTENDMMKQLKYKEVRY